MNSMGYEIERRASSWRAEEGRMTALNGHMLTFIPFVELWLPKESRGVDFIRSQEYVSGVRMPSAAAASKEILKRLMWIGKPFL